MAKNKNKRSKGGNTMYSRTVETETSTTYKPIASKADAHANASRNRGGASRSRKGKRDVGFARPDKIENNVATFQGKENDPSWYNGNGQLVKDAATVSFYTPAGAPFFSDSRQATPTKGAAVPGIMTLDVVPTPGTSTERASALNLAALKLYTGMRKANSGAVNYSHADLMMYCLAMDSVYIMYSEMLRLYGIMNCWSQYNRYKPEDIVTALGYNYADFRENMADFRAWLNIWIKRANSFSLPVSFTISKRHAWLFSNIWSDSTNAKAQLYAYRPAIYYEWDDQGSEQGSQLKYKFWNYKGRWNSSKSFAEVKQRMDSLLDQIANSDDIAIMGGDLEKAFGSQNMFNMASIDDNYSVEPTFSEEVLMQIENSMFLPGIFKNASAHDESWNITQNVDENKIVYDPEFEIQATGYDNMDALSAFYINYNKIYADGTPINMHFDNPSPDDVMVATRNKFEAVCSYQDWDGAHGGSIYITFKSVGCDFISDVAVWSKVNYDVDNRFTKWDPHLTGFNLCPYAPHFSMYQSMVPSELYKVISSIIAIDIFDWHPAVYAVVALDADPMADHFGQVSYVSMDLDNYTMLDFTTLHKVHDAAIYNMWDLPL